jgi:histidine-specific SAM-dependent methyltransferase
MATIYFFKNSELAERYRISLGTVRNWIEAAAAGRLELVLARVGERSHIANTAHNVAMMDNLVNERKKYRPHHTVRILKPDARFYRLFSDEQVSDIINNLEIRKEVPRQYNYFGAGAKRWHKHILRLDREAADSNLSLTRKLLKDNQTYIDGLLKDFNKVNVVDVGVGNALPVKDFLAHLSDTDKLGRYLAIDISREMLNIASQNISDWFDGKITVEPHELDITRSRLTGILPTSSVLDKATCNLFLFLGGTIQNFKNRDIPLHIINDSMAGTDLFIHTQKLDSRETRQQFDFSSESKAQALPSIHSLIIELLGIEPSLYELEQGYDPENRERFEQIRLKSAIEIEFTLGESKRRLTIKRGDAILLWRASQDSYLEVMNKLLKNGFRVLQATQTQDGQYLLTVSAATPD